MTDTVSIPALKQYLQTAADLGADSTAILEHCGQSTQILEDNRQRISLESFEQVVYALISACDHPHFGLHASRFVNPTTYLSLGLMSMSAERLRDAIELLPAYEALVGGMGVTALQEYQGDFMLRWDCRLRQPEVRRHVIDTVLSSWFRYGKDIAGLSGDLLGVYLEHDVDTSAYHELFGCTIHRNAGFNGLLLPSGALEQIQPQANSALLQSLLQHADTSLHALRQQGAVSQQVAALIAQQLDANAAEKPLDKAAVAAMLGLSARTLQRRLQAEHTSFHEIFNDVRQQRAKALLAGGSSMTDIAQQLGFSETRSFFRRFKQWTGTTAGRYRDQLRAQHKEQQ